MPRSRCAAKAHRYVQLPSRAVYADRLSCRSRNSTTPNCRRVDSRRPLRCVSLQRKASPDEVSTPGAYRHCSDRVMLVTWATEKSNRESSDEVHHEGIAAM